MYQDKLASLKRQLQQLQEGNHFFFFLWLKCVLIFQMWMSLTVSLYLVGCVNCVSCGIQDTARSWLMVVVRDYIIRPWRHLLGKFNSAALQRRNQLRNRWKLLTVFRHKWLILNHQACLLFTIAHTLAPVAETMLPNLYRWTYFYNRALYHYITHPTCLLTQFLNSWLGISCPMSCFIAETGVEWHAVVCF